MWIKSHQMEQLSQKRSNKKDVTAFKRKKNSSDRLCPFLPFIERNRPRDGHEASYPAFGYWMKNMKIVKVMCES